MFYYRVRFYSAQLGRFLEQDPSGYPTGMNLLAYAEDSPIGRLDPTGLIVVDNRAGYMSEQLDGVSRFHPFSVADAAPANNKPCRTFIKRPNRLGLCTLPYVAKWENIRHPDGRVDHVKFCLYPCDKLDLCPVGKSCQEVQLTFRTDLGDVVTRPGCMCRPIPKKKTEEKVLE